MVSFLYFLSRPKVAVASPSSLKTTIIVFCFQRRVDNNINLVEFDLYALRLTLRAKTYFLPVSIYCP